jgi:death on curing protein
MREPQFLALEEVLEIHADQLRRHGGAAGIRDWALLESALAAPQASWGGEFLHRDLAEMAAAYLHSIARNHAFVDGNKRVATLAAYTFLLLNGQELVADDESLEQFVLGVATGAVSKEEAAAFIREHCQPEPDAPQPASDPGS